MKFSALPDDLDLQNAFEVQIFNYQVNRDFYRNKIHLTKNTISFLRIGTKEVIGNNQNVIIDNERFVIMKAGKCLMTENISSEHRFYQSILLFFSDEAAIRLLEREKIKKTTKEANSFYAFNYDQYIYHFVNSLEHLMRIDAKSSQQLLTTKFEEIMLYLIHREGTQFLNDIVQNPTGPANRLINVVEKNRLNKLNLQELAFLTNMSVSTFKRAFYKHYEVSPSKWFHQQRLEHAALLLRTNQKRPIEIFEIAGYENFSNFVQAFKKEYGLTPKQYQRQD